MGITVMNVLMSIGLVLLIFFTIVAIFTVLQQQHNWKLIKEKAHSSGIREFDD